MKKISGKTLLLIGIAAVLFICICGGGVIALSLLSTGVQNAQNKPVEIEELRVEPTEHLDNELVRYTMYIIDKPSDYDYVMSEVPNPPSKDPKAEGNFAVKFGGVRPELSIGDKVDFTAILECEKTETGLNTSNCWLLMDWYQILEDR